MLTKLLVFTEGDKLYVMPEDGSDRVRVRLTTGAVVRGESGQRYVLAELALSVQLDGPGYDQGKPRQWAASSPSCGCGGDENRGHRLGCLWRDNRGGDA